MTCGLTVLRERTLRRLLPAQFTGDQWKYYWGITESDKFGKVYEALSATFFGLWISWFLTFLIGLPASTILGTVRRPGRAGRGRACSHLIPPPPHHTAPHHTRSSSSTGSWPRAWAPTAAT